MLLTMEIRMYEMITSGIPLNWNITISKIASGRKTICGMLSFTVNFFTFSENNGISAFMIQKLIIEMKSNTHGLIRISNTKSESLCNAINGRLRINKQLPGVGSPMKDDV